MKNKKLTFAESTMLVAGAGIGTGLLTIPYAVDKIGVAGTLVALALAYIASAFMYMIIADLVLNSKNSNDLLLILDEHLFGNRNRKILNVLFLFLMIILLLQNLVVYIVCAGDVIANILPINSAVSRTLFYILASMIIFFGIKGIGAGEKISVLFIGATVLMLSLLSSFNVKGSLDLTFGKPSLVFAVFGLFMFAFSAIFAIVQVCNHIENKSQIKKAILGGLTLNALITTVFSFAVIVGSSEVTQIGTIGISESLGIPGVKIICAVLVLFATFSSFWSSGLAFAEMVGETFKISIKPSWFVATSGALIISVFVPMAVLDFMQIGAGALSIILVIVVLPAYYNAVKNSEKDLLLGKIAKSKAMLYAVAASVVLMAISSLVPIA